LAVPEVEEVQDRRLAVVGSAGQVRTVDSEHGRPVTACRRADGALLRRLLVDALSRRPG
jgi:hypothetical protein